MMMSARILLVEAQRLLVEAAFQMATEAAAAPEYEEDETEFQGSDSAAVASFE
jgi:hypothetical protein